MSTQPADTGFARPYEPYPLQLRLAAVWAAVEREALLGFLLTIYAIVVLRMIPQELVQDSWLTLVSGREVAENGIPKTDSLTVWTKGVPWVDQQWLGQLIFYGAHVLGGFKLVMLLHAAALVTALGIALAAARSLGASVKSVALVAAVCMLLAPWALAMRAQTLAIPLFVALVWLLASDSRSPSRRVFLVLPLLVLWANIHGTVTLACALVVLRGLTIAVSRREGPRRLRATLLIALPFAALLASPYATELVGYYRTMLVSPTLRTFIGEWGPEHAVCTDGGLLPGRLRNCGTARQISQPADGLRTIGVAHDARRRSDGDSQHRVVRARRSRSRAPAPRRCDLAPSAATAASWSRNVGRRVGRSLGRRVLRCRDATGKLVHGRVATRRRGGDRAVHGRTPASHRLR